MAKDEFKAEDENVEFDYERILGQDKNTHDDDFDHDEDEGFDDDNNEPNEESLENDVESWATDESSDDHSSAATTDKSVTNSSRDLDVLASANFELKCEVGAVNLSFQEISELKVGDSIEFIKWPGKVKLRLNNLIFAEGYLVEINNMLGIKITNRYDIK